MWICQRTDLGRVLKKSCPAFKVPLGTVASIILKWKKCRATGVFSAGYSSKMSNLERKTLVRVGTKNLMGAVATLQRPCVRMGETSRRTTIMEALHESGLCGRVARQKPLFGKNLLEFTKKQPKDSQSVTNTVPLV